MPWGGGGGWSADQPASDQSSAFAGTTVPPDMGMTQGAYGVLQGGPPAPNYMGPGGPGGFSPEQQAMYGALMGLNAPRFFAAQVPLRQWQDTYTGLPAEWASQAHWAGQEAQNRLGMLGIDQAYSQQGRGNVDAMRQLYNQIYGAQQSEMEARRRGDYFNQDVRESEMGGMRVSGYHDLQAQMLGQRFGAETQALGAEHGLRLASLQARQNEFDKMAALYPFQRQQIENAYDEVLDKIGLSKEKADALFALAQSESMQGVASEASSIQAQIQNLIINNLINPQGGGPQQAPSSLPTRRR